ncbi:hypothetical protein [Neptuniibacter halophilus]|uniref:hypothetical protein n=1 Tax=Neptuniibacter halophilus TaxID=651666 RepID=UPI0025741729|nr:hypothetical protein [Neptuniibacter halophilus]
MRSVTLLIAFLGLSGCMSLDSITPGKGEPVDTSFYLIDIQNRFYCNGNSRVCSDMTKIVSSRAQLQPLEESYGQPVKGPNYPASLIRMVIKPMDGSYQSTPVGDEGRYFRVPKNDKTDLVWRTLQKIQNGHGMIDHSF